MENSFYYFFSATPQVLGGLLALFGVFVIFKIDSLKSEMLGIGRTIIIKLERGFTQLHIRHPSIIANQKNSDTLNIIQSYVEKADIHGLYATVSLIDAEGYTIYKQVYEDLLKIRKEIVKNTIHTSKFTAISICLCLLILPFGKWIVSSPLLLFCLFSVVLLCVVYILYMVISILKKSIL
jgi:hypothetical protein